MKNLILVVLLVLITLIVNAQSRLGYSGKEISYEFREYHPKDTVIQNITTILFIVFQVSNLQVPIIVLIAMEHCSEIRPYGGFLTMPEIYIRKQVLNLLVWKFRLRRLLFQQMTRSIT